MGKSQSRTKVAIFGHYGNKNMGDEAIIEAAIKNISDRVENCEIVCMSINPFDSQERHGVDAFPIRYRKDFFDGTQPATTPKPETSKPQNSPAPNSSKAKQGLKQTLKAIPVLGFLLRALASLLDEFSKLKQEIFFLKKGKAYLKDIDFLMITGSNQLLDNFGGAWGFPYTLLKWTLLAKASDTKVAFVSVGAGPLNLPLSYKMLGTALKNADFISYRDEGSKELIESRIDIDAPIYPDIAHSLGYKTSVAGEKQSSTSGNIKVAVNPMPVYDSRYWYIPDEKKFRDYVNKVYELCCTILTDGNELVLFSTQAKDENVIDDIMALLKENASYAQWQPLIAEAKCSQVSELMNTIHESDVVVATRFHATVLPLQLGKPTIGICYYRKAAELLDEFGLNEFHVDIDDFSSKTLIKQYKEIIPKIPEIQAQVQKRFTHYTDLLDEQYKQLVAIAER